MAGRIMEADVFGTLVHATAYNGGPAHCPYCGIRLVHMPPYQRHNAAVGAFYRRRAGVSHAVCKYNESQRVNRIVRFSTEFSNQQPIALGNDGKAKFLLQVIGGILRLEKSGLLPEAVRDAEGNVVISPQRVRSQSLRTAKAILGLVSRIENTAELSELINLDHKGRTIPWRDFYFPSDRNLRLYRQANRGIEFPIAMEITVKKVFPKEKKANYLINCHGEHIDENGSMVYFAPTIWVSDPVLAALFVESGTYLIFAAVNNISSNGAFRNLNITVNSRHQVCRVRTEH